jgi:predicted RNA-binding protein YlqC (UPF0109 family)
MVTLSEDPVGLVESIVRSLVDNQDAVSVISSEEDGVCFIEIDVDDDEVGKIIGKQGRIIKAIRTLARATSSDDVEVEVNG